MLVEHGARPRISTRNTRQLRAGVSLSDFGDGGPIAPGYVDLHIHGSAGCDVMDDRADHLQAIEQLLARSRWSHELFPNHGYRCNRGNFAGAGTAGGCD